MPRDVAAPDPAPERTSDDRHDAKARGAYYTDHPVADFLTRWALRAPGERALDPSFGGGVFLRAAAARLRALGAPPPRVAAQVAGVELDARAHAAAQLGLVPEGIDPARLRLGDFFGLEPRDLEPVDALLGNPPYVRYQALPRAVRGRAAQRAADAGVTLGGRAGLWAPFVVHAARFVRPGGRLALVLPSELDHAAYARPLLPFLGRAFARVTLLTFERPLFPQLDQGALLLLAEGRRPDGGSGSAAAPLWRDLPGAAALADPDLLDALRRGDAAAAGLRPLESARGSALRAALLPPTTLARYRALAADAPPLDALAEVRLGYVSGANRFFHLSAARAAELELPAAALTPAVYRGAALAGLRFDDAALAAAAAAGHAGRLLRLGRAAPDDPALRAYLTRGERDGVARGHKCRHRTPWYRVPSADPPDAALAMMGGRGLALAANRAGAAVANALLRVDLRPGTPLGERPRGAELLALLWRSSLPALGCELEGRPLGGGMLKLEPSAARRVPVPLPGAAALDALTSELGALDARLRTGGDAAAEAVRARVDALLVAHGALEPGDAEAFAAGLRRLRERRRRARGATVRGDRER